MAAKKDKPKKKVWKFNLLNSSYLEVVGATLYFRRSNGEIRKRKGYLSQKEAEKAFDDLVESPDPTGASIRLFLIRV